MAKKRSWSDEQLADAVLQSRSLRNVLKLLGLVPAGGNYDQVRRRIALLKIQTDHFTGMGWRINMSKPIVEALPLALVLIENSEVQSYKLKLRLFRAGIKIPECEMCGWAEKSSDGRIPVELDHINGNNRDNRIINLRILCPNCHSLQPTHRGRNKKVRLRNPIK